MNFRESDIFNGIEELDFYEMQKCFNPIVKTYKASQKVYTLDEETKHICIVKGGSVNIVRTDRNGTRTILENICNNEVFGSIFYSESILNDDITAICASDCTIMFIDYHHITKRCINACQYHTYLVQNMLSLISARASNLSNRVEVLSRRTTRDKLLSYFTLSTNNKDKKSFELPFSYVALADYLCVDRSAMMREIKHLKEEGLIKADKRIIELL